MSVSPQRRLEIMDSLRRGTVPRSSLDAFAVGLERFEGSMEHELRRVGSGGSVFKRSVASMAAARPSLPAGFPTVPASSVLRPPRFRSRRPRPHFIGWRRSTVD